MIQSKMSVYSCSMSPVLLSSFLLLIKVATPIASEIVATAPTALATQAAGDKPPAGPDGPSNASSFLSDLSTSRPFLAGRVVKFLFRSSMDSLASFYYHF
jgi:hypothetical protein